MKTPEDEAFDDIARRQGAWGGGYQAKRKMAADKLQEPIPPNLRINCTVKDDVNPNGISPEKWRGQSNIESQHNACQHKDYCKQLKAALAQPAQEPDALTIAYQSGFYDGKKAAQPPWVGLTDDEIEEIFQSAAGADEETHIRFAKAIEAKLKERNS